MGGESENQRNIITVGTGYIQNPMSDGDNVDEDKKRDGRESSLLPYSSANETHVQIAINVRCLDAMNVLAYLKILRDDKGGWKTAGYDWLADGTRCSAILDLLASVQAIHSLDSVFLRKLIPQLELRQFRKDEVIFHEGTEEAIVSLRDAQDPFAQWLKVALFCLHKESLQNKNQIRVFTVHLLRCARTY